MNTTRRNLLNLGAFTFISTLLSEVASPRAFAAPAKKPTQCVLLWMNGGASHLDSFDLKPGGHFKAIPTKARGVSICERLPQLADQMDAIALLRGVSSKEGNHPRAQSLAHTGHTPNPTVRAPALGAWVAKYRSEQTSSLPAFISLGGPSADAGFLGNGLDPFVVATPGAMPKDIQSPRAFSPEREALRNSFVDRMNRDFDATTKSGLAKQRSMLTQTARTMMRSSNLAAFDCSSESKSTLDAYGDSAFGRGCLTARRLIEVGVPFVEVGLDGWDTHQNNFERVGTLLDTVDAGAASLLADLRQRGLLDTTLVAWVTEFGRTPSVNADEGRDHHPQAFSVWLAGAGIRGGIVHGETDLQGARVTRDAVSLQDVVATMGSALGLETDLFQTTPNGRPITMTEGGKPIQAIREA
jgi:hypothetical protein